MAVGVPVGKDVGTEEGAWVGLGTGTSVGSDVGTPEGANVS